jgi:hypothetical protein
VSGDHRVRTEPEVDMIVLLWLVLLVVSWPLALLALVLSPIVWVLVLPFRVVGISVDGVLATLRAVVTLPARLLGAGRR